MAPPGDTFINRPSELASERLQNGKRLIFQENSNSCAPGINSQDLCQNLSKTRAIKMQILALKALLCKY